MSIDVDGAPNAYGPIDIKALDYELNAHVGAKESGKIVGYRTQNDDRQTPILQKTTDPFPGFYIAESAYVDVTNQNEDDPRRYVNAAEINYTLHATAAKNAGVKLGDFCVVHSLSTRRSVFAIVGDSGHRSGAEGSLALLQRLGYPVKNGKSGGVDKSEIVVRYFADSNSTQRFFFTQAELDSAALALDLDTDFSSSHAGDPGLLVLDAVGHTEASIEAARVEPFAPLSGVQGKNPPRYPGHLIERDSSDTASVKVLQKRLKDLGMSEPGTNGPRPLVADGVFGINTFNAVELFQMRHTDLDGRPMLIDGRVGTATWGALFGRETVPSSLAVVSSHLGKMVLETATSQVGALEKPFGSNAGPKVNEYLASVGLAPGNFWSMAFVYWCFREAAKHIGIKNPAIKTGSVLDAWNNARSSGSGISTLTFEDALQDPGKIKPGMVFMMSTGGGYGHTGIVVALHGNVLETIEGNTNDGGSSNGIGVFRRKGRTVSSINRGYIDYGDQLSAFSFNRSRED